MMGGNPFFPEADLPQEEKLAEALGAFDQIIDDVGGGVTYVCQAACGSLASAPKWQIKKITVVGAVTTIRYANGSTAFDKVANDRATYTY